MLSQYIECAEKFRSDHIANPSYNRWVWATDDVNLSRDEDVAKAIRTTAPKKLDQK